MRPPKNFDNKMNRRKQLLPEVPQATAADVDKVVKVNDDGEYELKNITELPDVTTDDNNKMAQVKNGVWTKTSPLTLRKFVVTDASSSIISTLNGGVKVSQSDGTISRYFLSGSATPTNITSNVDDYAYTLFLNINGAKYSGITLVLKDSNTFTALVYDSTGVAYIATIGTTISLTPIGSTKYIEIDISGTSASLPSGVTFADVYALLQAGVDVKFTVGARVHTITAFESTNIRAHWFSDFDLFNMDVSVINISSDGTGTANTVTFTGA